MASLSEFGISLGAGAVLELTKKLKRTDIQTEIKDAFEEALRNFYEGGRVDPRGRVDIKQLINKHAFHPEGEMINLYKVENYGRFFSLFNESIAKRTNAYNYLKEIKDSQRFQLEIARFEEIKVDLKKIKDDTEENLIVSKLIVNQLYELKSEKESNSRDTERKSIITSIRKSQKCIRDYAVSFSIDPQNLELSMSDFLQNLDQNIQIKELITRINTLDFEGKPGGKFETLFKNKIEDLILMPKSIRLREQSGNSPLIYKDFLDRLLSENSTNKYLLLAEAGGGKTALSYFMLDDILRRYVADLNNYNLDNGMLAVYIPLFLIDNVLDLANPLFIAKIYSQLKSIHINILELIKEGKICFIFDGLDELYLKQIDLSSAPNKRILRELEESYSALGIEFEDAIEDITSVNSGGSAMLSKAIGLMFNIYEHCPIIVTSRLHYYDTRKSELELGQFEIYQLKPFSSKQQFDYIKKRIGENKQLYTQVVNSIKSIPNLFDLAPVPVLLEMIVNIMILENKNHTSKDTLVAQQNINRAYLYNKIVKEWSKQHISKLEKKWEIECENFTDEFVPKFENVLETEDLSDLMMLVALAMFNSTEQSHGGLLISPNKIVSFLKKVGNFKKNDAKLLVELMNSIFSATNRVKERGAEAKRNRPSPYSFSHKTILEFLVAKSIYNNLIGINNLVADVQLSNILSVPIDFQDDDEVVKFIDELIQNNESNKEIAIMRLLDLLNKPESSKKKERVKNNNVVKIIAYINNKDLSAVKSITKLNLSEDAASMYNSMFEGRDFQGLRLVNTNFSGQSFKNANLKESTLLGAGLSRCCFDYANFENANLTAAYLGQSSAIWSFERITNDFITDNGNGELALMPIAKGLRQCNHSDRDRIIWDVNKFTFQLKQFAICAQQGNLFSILDIEEAKTYLFERNFNETLFSCTHLISQNKLFFAGSKGNIYLIDKINILLNGLGQDEYEKLHPYRTDFPESYKNKHHTGTIFGLSTSSCGEFLFSCGSDSFVKCWNHHTFSSNPTLNSEIFNPLCYFKLSDKVLSTDENRFRKIITINHNGKDFLLVGTQLGWLVILEVIYDKFDSEKVKLNDVAIIQSYHEDWILDISYFQDKDDIIVLTVSGDHSSQAISLNSLLTEKSGAKPFWKKSYSTAILSVSTERDKSPSVYFGTYNGNILEENKRTICDHLTEPNLKNKFWNSDVWKSVSEEPDSVIKSAKLANFKNVSGLNKGRMLLIQRKEGMLNHDEMIKFYKNKLIDFQELVMDFFIDSPESYKEKNIINVYESFITDFELKDSKSLKQLLDQIKEYLESLKHSQLKSEEVIDLYQEFTELKVIYGSILMTLYWCQKNNHLENLSHISEFYIRRKGMVNSVFKLLKQSENENKRDVFNQIVLVVKDFLENYFMIDGEENKIFVLTYEDYRSNDRLRFICDFLGGVDTNWQIPNAFENIGVNHIWTEINNQFWIGSSAIAKSYFDDFVSKIYKCCGETHAFLISRITKMIRQKIDSSDENIVYHDFATGSNGTIMVGVYQQLSAEERKSVSFIASDSSEKILKRLKTHLLSKGYYGEDKISLQQINLGDLTALSDCSIDVITQNLGGHHLPKSSLEMMYSKFYSCLRSNGYMGIGDVFFQPIKILSGLPDDVGAPEYPYDVRDLKQFIPEDYKNLLPIDNAAYPQLGKTDGFYTVQVYKKNAE